MEGLDRLHGHDREPSLRHQPANHMAVPIAALTRRVEVLLGDDFLRLGSEAGVPDLPSSAGFEPA
jgi:hypothetical protein